MSYERDAYHPASTSYIISKNLIDSIQTHTDNVLWYNVFNIFVCVHLLHKIHILRDEPLLSAKD